MYVAGVAGVLGPLRSSRLWEGSRLPFPLIPGLLLMGPGLGGAGAGGTGQRKHGMCSRFHNGSETELRCDFMW